MNKKFKSISIIFILFIIALIPRIYELDQTEIYPDEITWMVRGKETIYALKQLNFKYFDTAWWNINNDTQAISLPLVLINGPFLILLGKSQSIFSLGLLSDIVSARLPVVVLNSFFILIFYFFLRKIFSPGLSFFTSILLAFDPIMIGFGRMVINDGLLTFFTFTAIYGFLFLDKIKSIIISGTCLSLGFLTKPNGLLPLLSWIIYSFCSKENKKILFRKLLITIVISLFIIIIIWPASWNKPFISIFEYSFKQIILLEQQPIRQFFMGEVTYNPPFYFYLFQILFRLPLPILIGLIFSPVFIYFKIKNSKKMEANINYPKFISIIIYCFIFILIASSVSQKLSVKYILPLWPWIYILSCWTIFEVANLLKNHTLRIMFLFFIVIINLIIVIQYAPNYQLFYNQFIGGPKDAQKYNLVGLCSGTKKALEFLDKNYALNKPVAIMGCSKVVAPYYSSRTITTDWQKSNLVIIEYAFEQLMSNNEVITYFAKLKPIFIVEEKGAILSKIYFKN